MLVIVQNKSIFIILSLYFKNYILWSYRVAVSYISKCLENKQLIQAEACSESTKQCFAVGSTNESKGTLNVNLENPNFKVGQKYYITLRTGNSIIATTGSFLLSTSSLNITSSVKQCYSQNYT